jgi:hypothetical protein
MASVTLPAVLAVGGITAAGSYITKDQPNHDFSPARIVLGTAGLGLFLAAIESVSPDVARGFAVLLIVSVLLINGQPVFQFISQRAGSNA